MQKITPVVIAFLLTLLAVTPCRAQTVGNAIFIHPDGASASTWTAARALWVGPDGALEWDKLPHVAIYRGHMRDCLTPSSNGGGNRPRHRGQALLQRLWPDGSRRGRTPYR